MTRLIRLSRRRWHVFFLVFFNMLWILLLLAFAGGGALWVAGCGTFVFHWVVWVVVLVLAGWLLLCNLALGLGVLFGRINRFGGGIVNRATIVLLLIAILVLSFLLLLPVFIMCSTFLLALVCSTVRLIAILAGFVWGRPLTGSFYCILRHFFIYWLLLWLFAWFCWLGAFCDGGSVQLILTSWIHFFLQSLLKSSLSMWAHRLLSLRITRSILSWCIAVHLFLKIGIMIIVNKT